MYIYIYMHICISICKVGSQEGLLLTRTNNSNCNSAGKGVCVFKCGEGRGRGSELQVEQWVFGARARTFRKIGRQDSAMLCTGSKASCARFSERPPKWTRV